ncbi:MAG: YihY/virulence factor BrkB family protein [Chitinophagaceae bacterium]
MPQVRSKKNEVLIFFSSLRPSLLLFRKNDPLRMAGATAFFTTFALPPIIFLLVQLFGLIIGRKNMGSGLLEGVSGVLGKDGADQVSQVIQSIRGFNNNWYVIVIGFIFLVFVATTLFNVIKDSLNQLWQISVKEKPGLLFMLSIRLRSFAVILFVGVLFLADVFFQSLEIIAGDFINSIWQDSGLYFKSFIREAVGIIIVSVWFIVLFRFLADGRPSWKASLLGGLLTGILFAAGRVVLTVLLINSNIGHLYGPSGSFVLILLFVFYSSFILYFGASFIAVYSDKKGWPIRPNDMAYAIENG